MTKNQPKLNKLITKCGFKDKKGFFIPDKNLPKNEKNFT